MTTSLTWQVAVRSTGTRSRAHAFVTIDGAVEAVPLCEWDGNHERRPELEPATSEEITTNRCHGCDDEMRERSAA